MDKNNAHLPLIELRPFQASDQTPVRDLILSGLQERWGNLDPALNKDLHNIGETFSGGHILVACAGNQIIGCGGLLPVDETTAQIVRMSTAAAWRRIGVASRLLSALEREARLKGFSIIVLETTSNWKSAVQFYQSRCYQITHYDGGDTYFTKQLA